MLSGRYVKTEVLPFSFSEYAELNKKDLSRQSYVDFMDEGGLPELSHLPKGEIRSFVSSLKDTVLFRDIVQIRHKDSRLLEDLLVYILNNASNDVCQQYHQLSERPRAFCQFNTVSKLSGLFENSYIIHGMERYDIKGKSLLSRVCKYYA